MATAAVNPQVSTLKITTEAQPNNGSIDRADMTESILAGVDWDQAEARDKGRGPYHTTTAFSWNAEDGQYRYQFSLSVNRYPLAGTGTNGKFKLSANELKTLARIAGKAADSGNSEMANYAEALRTQKAISAEDIEKLAALEKLA